MKEDKKGKASLIVIIIIMFACIGMLIWMIVTDNQDINLIREVKTNVQSTSYKTKAVVVKVDEKGLYAILKDNEELCRVGYAKEGNIGFKKGQEILIHFDGTVMESYPAQLGNVEKIEILHEKSSIEIPTSALQYCYNSNENVELTLKEFTKERVEIEIKDTNELPYDYSNYYAILRKNENNWEELVQVSSKIYEPAPRQVDENSKLLTLTFDILEKYGLLQERRI